MATKRTDPNGEPAAGTDTAARAWLAKQGASILAEQIELARIPAPPFEERTRAEAIATRLADLGLASAFDEVGNLHAWFPRNAAVDTPPIVIAAHVDTVFGPGTTIDIRSEGDRWVGPGITDNARGLAVSLVVLRALLRGDISPRHPILFAFTVGEEGRGDLRGVKHLFRASSPLRAATAFIAVDGSGLRRIIHQALGSRRFRVSVRGPGGHSWTDWGRTNPANAVGEFIYSLARLDLPPQPRTTLTVARLGGGTSINAIPAESWVELDLRSEAADTIQRTESRLHELADIAVEAERGRGTGELTIDWEPIGERPAGILATSHPLVQAAVQASRAAGAEPEFAASSTDANVPMALGIPAIAIGGGGDSGDTHTEHEWFVDSDGALGALRLFDILATLASF
ncbi:MAG TPA: M20/M25/M40 family metallo-hydrolase [Gemmatimonadota bacterium]|nr:M20/M25/M40 family metallo-hydrolase [Gemmatimonadota bacterium]